MMILGPGEQTFRVCLGTLGPEVRSAVRPTLKYGGYVGT